MRGCRRGSISTMTSERKALFRGGRGRDHSRGGGGLRRRRRKDYETMMMCFTRHRKPRRRRKPLLVKAVKEEVLFSSSSSSSSSSYDDDDSDDDDEVTKTLFGVPMTPETSAIASRVFRPRRHRSRLVGEEFFLKDELHLSPAEAAVVMSISSLPWLVKTFVGVYFGYRAFVWV